MRSLINRLTNQDLRALPQSLEYVGEFGPELVLFLPFCNWLSKAGFLRKRQIVTYFGMRCFYEDLECLEVIEKKEKRCWIPPSDRPAWLPVKNEHDFDGLGRPRRHIYPDLRKKFKATPLSLDIAAASQPLLVIHNKHCDEWSTGGPVNHISLDTLDVLFSRLKQKFTIVYIRHGIEADDPRFSGDHNHSLPFDDKSVLADHCEVRLFDHLYAEHIDRGGRPDINAFKNILYSRCHNFISSQGGGAHHIALFSGSLLAILHRRGFEENWAYKEGYYGFMASPPPLRAIFRSEDDLVSGISLFERLSFDETEGSIPKSLSPKNLVSENIFY